MSRKVKWRFIAGILIIVLVIMESGVCHAEDTGNQAGTEIKVETGKDIVDNKELDEEENNSESEHIETVVKEAAKYSFTLPLETSEYWIPVQIDAAGSSVDITISSDEEKFQAPVSYLFCKGRDTGNYIGEVGAANMAGDAIKETNTSGFHCAEAGEYNIRITNASFINNIGYAGQVNTKPLYVSYEIIPGDAYECNDTKETATSIEPNKPLQFTLNGQNDEDWFEFYVFDGDIPIAFGLDHAEKEEGVLWKDFDSPICYWLYLDLGDSLETVASGAGMYGQGAASRPFTKDVAVSSPGKYYLRFVNASKVNTLYYKKGDNKTPLSLTCSFAGNGLEILYDGDLGEEISDFDLFRDYPEYLHNALTDRVEDNIIGRTNQALDNVYGGEFLTAYKYALDKGGLSIMLKEAAAYLGWGKSMDEEFAEEAAREYIEALSENENYMEEIAQKSLSKVKFAKKWWDIETDAITSKLEKDISSDFEWMDSESAKKFVKGLKDDYKTFSDILKEGGRVLTFGEIAISVLTLQDIRLEILYSVRDSLPQHTELYKQFNKLIADILRDPYQVIVENFFSKAVVEEVLGEIESVVSKVIFETCIEGEVSSLTVSLAKIGTKYISKMIPAAKADDTIKAIYKHMYTASIRNSVINNLQREFVQYKVDNNTDIQEKINEYERMYKLYLLALNEDIQSAKKVADSNGKLLLEGAEYALKNYSYERYIKLCKMAVRQETGGSSGLQYQIVGDKVIVSGNGIPKERVVSEAVSEIIIPSEIQGQAVFKVGDEAFKGNKEMEILVIEEGVNIIGKEAFADCTNLKQVYLPDTVTVIREGAFANCTQLQDIRTGKGLEKIEENALLNTDIKTLYSIESAAIQTYAEENNISFVKEKKIEYMYIDEYPHQLNYKADEAINTEGMKLRVKYMDGTSEAVTEGWIAICEHRGAGSTSVLIFYGDQQTDFIVNLEAVDVSYTIRYVDEDGNSIAEDVVKDGKSGDHIFEYAPEIEGYTSEEFQIDQYIWVGENIVEFVYHKDESDYTCGDINQDGEVNLFDLMICLNHVARKAELEGEQFQLADVDKSGNVDLYDLMRILNYVSKKTTEI